ncbi:MAG: hypothetical protein M5R36_13860 [Deltaproteobacteria bacterium]|nr:hypothetical protein [Deltaproteobacteria bacterium]
MKKSVAMVLGVGVAVAGLVAFRFASRGEEKVESIEDIQKTEGVPVEALAIERAPFERWRVFSGAVEGKVQASIYAHFPARVRAVHARQGGIRSAPANSSSASTRSPAPAPTVRSIRRACALKTPGGSTNA